MKTHGQGERSFAAALRAYFKQQTREIAAAIRERGAVGGVDSIFRPDDWNDRLRALVEDQLTRLAVFGAEGELKPFEKAAQAHPNAMDLPDRVVDAVNSFIDGAIGQPHWNDVNAAVRQDLADALKESVQGGYTQAETADRVASALGGASKERAQRIARTETTGALNAGAQASREHLASLGLVKKKAWLCIVDRDTREAHRHASGQEVGVNEAFNVGGEQAAYPGDSSLSAANRVHCRCTTISVIEEPEEPKPTPAEPPEVTPPPTADPTPAPTLAPALQPKPVGNPSAAHTARVQNAMEALPQKVKDLMADHGATVKTSRTLPEAAPDLPKNTDGVFRGSTKEIYVAEGYTDANGKFKTLDRAEKTARHEAGHAVDSALKWYSSSPEYRDAWEADVAAMTDEERKRLSYYTGAKIGRKEAFAELFANLHGGGARPEVLRLFPRVAKLVQAKLGSL